VVRVTYLLRMIEITHGSSLEPYSPSKRQMVWLRGIEAEIDLWECCGWERVKPTPVVCVHGVTVCSQLRVFSCLDLQGAQKEIPRQVALGAQLSPYKQNC